MTYLSFLIISVGSVLLLPPASKAQYDMATCIGVCEYILALRGIRGTCETLCDNYMMGAAGRWSRWNSYTTPIRKSSRGSIRGRWVINENDPMPEYRGANPVPIWGNGWNPTLRHQFEEQRKKENANLNCDTRYTYKFYCAPKDPNWQPPPGTPIFHLQNQGNAPAPPRPPPRRHGQQSHGG